MLIYREYQHFYRAVGAKNRQNKLTRCYLIVSGLYARQIRVCVHLSLFSVLIYIHSTFLMQIRNEHFTVSSENTGGVLWGEL